MWQMQLLLAICSVVFVGFVLFALGYVGTRLYFIITDIKRKRIAQKFSPKRRKNTIKTLVIAGSGGHTSEILRLVESLSDVYSPREYILAKTDKMSRDKIKTLEKQREPVHKNSQYSITTIPRSREVKQSWVTSFFTTLYACLYSLPIVFKSRPDLILCNGPGTCIPLCIVAFILTVLGIKKVTIVYIESICRVTSLSLSGRILYYFADHILVQWPELAEKYQYCRYIGRIV